MGKLGWIAAFVDVAWAARLQVSRWRFR